MDTITKIEPKYIIKSAIDLLTNHRAGQAKEDLLMALKTKSLDQHTPLGEASMYAVNWIDNGDTFQAYMTLTKAWLMVMA